MRVLVTGAGGQLGYDVVKRLKESNIECLGTARNVLDITNEAQTKEVITNYKPDVVVHCAAYTAVDKAEDERELCYDINVRGTKYVAKASQEIGAKMVYISTDYVFDGEGDKPFEVTHKPSPINYYGQTKYEGELEVQNLLKKFFIIRTSWIFGVNGNNFVKTMLKLAIKQDELSVVDDQVGSPTYTYDLANLIINLIQTEEYGKYHVTNEGYCSWYKFACEIFRQSEREVKVYPIESDNYRTRAKRPKNSRLDCNSLQMKLKIACLPSWENSLTRYIIDLKSIGIGENKNVK